jgi:hypothetical protein
MTSAYNVITTGRSDGQQLLGTAGVDALYAAGRTRPDIVDPADSTLRTTAHVAAAAALLVETGHGNAALSMDAGTTNRAGALVRNAERAEVVKAALMAGADRITHDTTSVNLSAYRGTVANRTVNGLDRRYGAGQLDIRNSYRIVAAGEQNSTEDGNASANVNTRGFDYDAHFGGLGGSNATATYPLPVQSNAAILTATLAWNLHVAGGTSGAFDGTATLNDLDLELVDQGNGEAVVMSSASTLDNTENLWIVVPANAHYALRVTRKGSFDGRFAIAWQLLRDSDGDAAYDEQDNCTSVQNPSQVDADGDGYGNICDADLNNSHLVTATDFNLLRSCLNQPASASALCAAADMNSTGLVTTTDFNIMRSLLNMAPGPSGLHPP